MDDLPLNLEKFMHNGIVFDQVKGAGAVDDVLNVDYLGFVVMMRPSMFLTLCPPLPAGETAHFDGSLGMPFLTLDIEVPERVLSHEGRHRMLFCRMAAGDEPVPVAILPVRGARARHITDEMVSVLAAGIRAERSEEDVEPAFVEGPLFERYLLSGRRMDVSPPTWPAP